jgi:NOL1/NOP2/sun family putative RNA methylase
MHNHLSTPLERMDTKSKFIDIQGNPHGKEYCHLLSLKYGYHEWMISRFLEFIPQTEKLLEHIESNLKSGTEYIRANSLKIDPPALKKALVEKGYTVKDTALKEVFEVSKPNDKYNSNKNDKGNPKGNVKNGSILPAIGSTIEYLRGYYYIQDLSSCMAVEEMELGNYDGNTDGRDLNVLDMAAAPGGKTTFIAQKMKNNGTIIALEPNAKRISPLIFNLSRCKVKNALVFNIGGEDARKLEMEFDRILLDAPCSCEGIIGKDFSRKKSRRLKDIYICSIKQKTLIDSAIKLLKPNGIMVYCTCSFAPEENEMVIDNLVRNNDTLEIEPVKYGIDGLTRFNGNSFVKQMINTKRLYPHIHHTNGFFIAKIRKR